MQHSNGFLQLVNDSKSRIREVTVASVREKLQKGHSFHFIDIREDHEWTRGRAEGAVHLGKGIIERDIEALVPDADEEIVLYCGGGYRSALSADALQRMGYRNVFSLAGGYKEWVASGNPITGA
ncbi:MAG: rhodanese-like domain-containing protein [Acidobacteriota bacterium]|nr:rhodanese-like domain-containing protein [Acidobacteriota bacterium]